MRVGFSSCEALVFITLVSVAITYVDVGLTFLGAPERVFLENFLILFAICIQIQTHI